MHLPSGILDGHTEAITGGLAVAGIVGATTSAVRTPDARLRPDRFAAVSAAVFAGQMLNFPVAAGTSGHLIGAAVAVALLGWAGGLLSLSLVLVVQCLLFADGGVSALGANVVNLAIVPALVAAVVLRGRTTMPRIALAGLVSVLAAAAAFSVEHAVGGTGDPAGVLTSMVGVHLLIGAGEAAITVAFVKLAQPVIQRPGLLVAAAALAVFAAPWASGRPDGLERVAVDRDLVSFTTDHPIATPFADYALGGGRPGVIVAGLVGVALVAGAGWGVARAARPRPLPA
jgi:cobalt/nickel transport system permease protein